MRFRLVSLSLVCALAGAGMALPGPAATPRQFVLSPEDNNLWAYDAASGAHQLVIRAVNGTANEKAPAASDRRDINGQICVAPDGRHIVTGEDTVIKPASGSGDSHDPRIAGWSYMTITGSSLGSIVANQIGKLAPEAGVGPGYTGDPDNYGCGFLDADRLLTTAIGNTLPGQPANGQLFLWFGPFDNGYREEQEPSGVKFFVGEVGHCQIDDTLATAGGIAVDRNGDVYVATNRPDDRNHPGGIWRYRGQWPTTLAECTPAYLSTHIKRELVIPFIKKLPADLRAPTPSAVIISPDDTLYVSSVFSGTVSEFTKAGNWVRDLYPLSPLTVPTGPTGNTPYGLATTADGSLWIADLGIVLDQPVSHQGSLIKVPFNDNRDPVLFGLGAATIRAKLTFPDGLGVYTPAA